MKHRQLWAWKASWHAGHRRRPGARVFIAQPMWLQSWFCRCKCLVSCSAQLSVMVMSASCQSFPVACWLEEHAHVVPPTDSSGGLSTFVFCWYTAENLAKESVFASYIMLLWKTLGSFHVGVLSYVIHFSVFPVYYEYFWSEKRLSEKIEASLYLCLNTVMFWRLCALGDRMVCRGSYMGQAYA